MGKMHVILCLAKAKIMEKYAEIQPNCLRVIGSRVFCIAMNYVRIQFVSYYIVY